MAGSVQAQGTGRKGCGAQGGGWALDRSVVSGIERSLSCYCYDPSCVRPGGSRMKGSLVQNAELCLFVD